MGSCDKCESIIVVERLGNILPESVTGTTGADAPTASVIGVGPQQVAHGSLMGYLLDSVESSDVVKSIDTRRQTTVKTKDLVINEGG